MKVFVPALPPAQQPTLADYKPGELVRIESSFFLIVSPQAYIPGLGVIVKAELPSSSDGCSSIRGGTVRCLDPDSGRIHTFDPLTPCVQYPRAAIFADYDKA